MMVTLTVFAAKELDEELVPGVTVPLEDVSVEDAAAEVGLCCEEAVLCAAEDDAVSVITLLFGVELSVEELS